MIYATDQRILVIVGLVLIDGFTTPKLGNAKLSYMVDVTRMVTTLKLKQNVPGNVKVSIF